MKQKKKDDNKFDFDNEVFIGISSNNNKNNSKPKSKNTTKKPTKNSSKKKQKNPKKKKPLKKYIKRFNRIEKTAYNTLNTVSNRIEVQKVKDGALDYQKCLEIYNKQREINNESV